MTLPTETAIGERAEALSRGSAYVTPTLNERRLQDGLAAVNSKRVAKARTKKLSAGGLSVLAAAAAATLFFAYGEQDAWTGETALVTTDFPVTVTLADGSEVTAHAETSIRRTGHAPATSLSLDKGMARFQVQPQNGGEFVVTAGEVSVRVVGTDFTVERALGLGDAPGSVHVSVAEGTVEVRFRETVSRLTAGDTWTQDLSVDSIASAVDTEPEPSAVPAGVTDAPTPEMPAEVAQETAPNTGRAGRPESARALFDLASAARREGRAREAADHYARFVSLYPRDGRTSLAAFELGRLRMDHLGDRRGATVALRRAVRGSGPGGSLFREDALARLVRIHDGENSSCDAFRLRYLAEYPTGRYASDVTRRCGEGPQQ